MYHSLIVRAKYSSGHGTFTVYTWNEARTRTRNVVLVAVYVFVAFAGVVALLWLRSILGLAPEAMSLFVEEVLIILFVAEVGIIVAILIVLATSLWDSVKEQLPSPERNGKVSARVRKELPKTDQTSLANADYSEMTGPDNAEQDKLPTLADRSSHDPSAHGENRKASIEISSLARDELVDLLQEMDPYAFEKFIADLWECRGWNTRVTSEAGDRGIDVVANKDEIIPEKQLIQAKKICSRKQDREHRCAAVL